MVTIRTEKSEYIWILFYLHSPVSVHSIFHTNELQNFYSQSFLYALKCKMLFDGKFVAALKLVRREYGVYRISFEYTVYGDGKSRIVFSVLLILGILIPVLQLFRGTRVGSQRKHSQVRFSSVIICSSWFS